jgi:peptidyl-prolyl cis-trans isomerase NIMA-interacting 1
MILTQDPITRTPDEAMEIIKSYQSKIDSGSISLGELAASESDCNSARKHGDLGYFGRGEMQPEFENAAFKLNVGEISPIVSSQSGLHLIERIA